jgi:N-carbamoylputrescine amidase
MERKPKKVKLGLVQMRCTTEPEQNLKCALDKIELAADKGAQIICTQELFRSQYFCQVESHKNFELAESIPGPTTDALCEIAKRRRVVIIGSLFEKRAPGIYHNTAVVIDADGQLLGKYRKMHIPDDPLYYEKFYFTPGDLGFRSFDTKYAKVGTLVCWDQWFPEAARLTALSGAEILFYPTAIGWHPDEKQEYGERQINSWELIQRSHSVANGVFVASVNRVGHEGEKEGGIQFWGNSFVSDPSGQVLARADNESEDILIVECDLGAVETARVHWPFLRDRRIDAYQNLLGRYSDETNK